MKVYTSENIKNVVLLGHGGCGKTTLVEAMARVAGITKRLGRVEDGNTVSDFDKEEIKRKFSINTSIIPIEWQEQKLNILDTPGYFDFAGETKEAVRVADCAVIVVSGKAGVEVGTEKAWDYAEELNLPVIIFVTDMDDDKADYQAVLNDLKEHFGKSIAPIQLPFYENEHFVGFVNVAKMEGRKFVKDHVEDCPIPPELTGEIESLRDMIMEAVAETDEVLMEKYFAGEVFTFDEIQNALHTGVTHRDICPVLCGSSINQTGVTVLLNAISKYMPAPKEEHANVEAIVPGTDEIVTLRTDVDETLAALVFKTIVDPYVGKLSLFRVYSGVLKADSQVLNVNKDETERISHIYLLRGKEQLEVSEIRAGDIGAIAKLVNTGTGDTLCDPNRPVQLEGVSFPESLAYRAITPKTKGDEDKISAGLHRLMDEDPTIKLFMDSENHQELLYGVGGLHLEVITGKLEEKFKVSVNLFKPKTPYRETIKKKVRVQGKHRKQSGGHGQYGDVHMEFEPSGEMEKAYIFEEKIVGGAVPKNYFPAVEKGLQECVKSGELAGYPVVGVKATLVDGSYHDVDSSEMAFKMATHIAFKKGFMEASPTLLEPIVEVKVIIPDNYMGDVIGDLNKRRGRIMGMNPYKGNKQEVVAEVPMSEMYGYSTDLRSMTGARGSFTQKFNRYEEAPHEVQQKVISERAKEEVEAE